MENRAVDPSCNNHFEFESIAEFTQYQIDDSRGMYLPPSTPVNDLLRVRCPVECCRRNRRQDIQARFRSPPKCLSRLSLNWHRVWMNFDWEISWNTTLNQTIQNTLSNSTRIRNIYCGHAHTFCLVSKSLPQSRSRSLASCMACDVIHPAHLQTPPSPKIGDSDQSLVQN